MSRRPCERREAIQTFLLIVGHPSLDCRVAALLARTVGLVARRVGLDQRFVEVFPMRIASLDQCQLLGT